MSHSLHRYGTREDLQNDFCMYARCAKGVNRDHPGEKLKKILDIYLSEQFVNFGSSHAGRSFINGLDVDEYRNSLDHSYGIIINFSEREAVKGVLTKLKKEDLGISIVVSGLIDEVRSICREVGLKPHTATLSLGIFGKKEKLPDESTLKVITMCGHSLIGAPLVQSCCSKARNGIITVEEAADRIARPCTCGIFNTVRCAELIKKQLETESKNSKKLFTPIRIGSVEVKNRVIQPSMCVFFNADDGHVNDTFCDYVRERAAGGVGLLIIPGSPHGKVSAGRPAISDDIYIEDWKRLSDIAHAYGSRLFCQIHPAKFQAGRGHAVETPEDYTEDDIRRLVDSYAAGALRAKKAGVDGVEIHGGHAHEVAMFMSPFYNHRTDSYGGGPEGRARFPKEIIEGIKRVCGADYPVIFRISGNEYVKGGRDIADSARICQILEVAGADAIHVSSGMPASEGYISAPMDKEDCFNVDAAAYMKQQVKIPVIAVNRIVDMEEAVQVVEDGKADMVAMARAHLADPNLVNKYLGKNPEPARRCVGCNQGCRDNAARKKIICMQNPFLGYSRDRVLEPVNEHNKNLKILIAGAGPAGLEAACDLTARGFHVELCEKTDNAGGLVRLAAAPPAKENMNSITQYRVEYLKLHGVAIQYGTEVTPELVAQKKPDVLVVATGSRPFIPQIPGIDGKNVFVCDEVLEGKLPEGRRIAVLGGGLIGCEAADYLAHKGKEVVMIDVIPELAVNLNPSRRRFMLERMADCAITYRLQRTVTSIALPRVTINGDEGEEVLDGIDALVVAAGRRPVQELSSIGEANPGMKVVTIGDAKKVGLALDAIHEAAAVACEIGMTQ